MKTPDKDLQQGQELRGDEQQKGLQQQTSTKGGQQQLGRTEQQQEGLSQQELDKELGPKKESELSSDLDEE